MSDDDNVRPFPRRQPMNASREPVPCIVATLEAALERARSGDLRAIAIASVISPHGEPLYGSAVHWDAKHMASLYLAFAQLQGQLIEAARPIYDTEGDAS